MAKRRTLFCCKECGHESPKWLGRCPACGEWNTFVEAAVGESRGRGSGKREPPAPLSAIATDSSERTPTGIAELDRVLGGGVVSGGVVLVGGDPGIGKSTLLLQMSDRLARSGETVLYVSGEESRSQIRMRANRLGIGSAGILILSETDVAHILVAGQQQGEGEHGPRDRGDGISDGVHGPSLPGGDCCASLGVTQGARCVIGASRRTWRRISRSSSQACESSFVHTGRVAIPDGLPRHRCC